VPVVPWTAIETSTATATVQNRISCSERASTPAPIANVA
jgi:hypothetical protein